MEQRLPIIRMNFDDSPRNPMFWKPGDCSYILNCHVGNSVNGERGAVENPKGNTLVVFSLPAGTNRCIGSFENKGLSRAIFFNYNSGGNHGIYEYSPATSAITELFSWDKLAFTPTMKITGVGLVDDYLYFTDNLNEPRKVNILRARAGEYAPLKTTEKYFANLLRQPPALALLVTKRNQVDDNPAWDAATAYVAGDKVKKGGKAWLSIQDGTNQDPLTQAAYWKQILYANYIRENAWQFTYRYVYDDYEKSTFAPTSALVPFPYQGLNQSNYVRVSLPATEVPSKLVQRIEFAVRQGNFEPFQLIDTLRRGTGGSFPATYIDFYNDKIGAGIDAAESILPFHYVPIAARSLAVIKSRVHLANYLEGYDRPKVGLTADFEPALADTDTYVLYHQVRTQDITTYQDGAIIDTRTIVDDFYYAGVTGSDTVYLLATSAGPFVQPQTPISLSSLTYTNFLGLPPGASNGDEIHTTSEVNEEGSVELSTDSTITDASKSFKQYCQYAVGVVFKDWGGRHIGVLGVDDNQRIFVGKRPADAFPPALNIRWTLTNPADIPLWAHSYSFVVTRNLTMASFVQFRALDLYYAHKKTDGTYQHTRTYSLSESFTVIDIAAMSTIQTGYVYQAGDRVRLYAINGNEYVDLEIKDQAGNLLYAQLADLGTSSTVLRAVVDVYTPAKAASELLYYEVGETFLITQPGEVTRNYSQSTGILLGDIYLVQQPGAEYYGSVSYPYDINTNPGTAVINTTSGVTSEILEAPNPWNKYYTVWYTNEGRATTLQLDARQLRKSTGHRFGGKFLEGTQINELSAFEAGNEKILPVEYGACNKLQPVNQVLLSIHHHETVSIYVEEALLQDTKGSTLISISDRVIGSENRLRSGHGTEHPETVHEFAGRVYWWDINKSAVVRYSGDGNTPISDYKAVAFFQQKTLDYRQAPFLVAAGFDAPYECYRLTLGGDTISFYDPILKGNPSDNSWTSFWSFLPEYYASVGRNAFLCFQNGACWVQHTNPVCNSYFGITYPRRIGMVYNDNPGADKIFQSLVVEAESVWTAPAITTPEGQSSNLIAEDFEAHETQFLAALLKDVNTPNVADPLLNGDELRSKLLSVRLENSDTVNTRLFFVSAGYQLSGRPYN